MTESAERTPHPDEPAEGGREAPEGGGKTPHPEQPAEGSEEAGEEGLDPENRITGV
jgi:hypothetical protein